MHPTDRTWAEIHLNHLTHNYNTIRAHLPETCHIMGVVKANAYGHGAPPVATHLAEIGCNYFAVVCLSEAMALRTAGIHQPILVFAYTDPKYAALLAENKLTQAVNSLEMAEALNHALSGTGQRLTVHITLDSGLGRLGFPCRAVEPRDALAVMALPNLKVEGIFTHFSVADTDEDDYTLGQLDYFTAAADWLEAQSGQSLPLRHAAGTGATLRLEAAHLNMVRPGLSLYGYSPNPTLIPADLKPVMELKTRLIQVRDFAEGEYISYGKTYQTRKNQRLAVVPVGYSNGLQRVLSGKIDMLV
ncbi:MAG: alanine racemase, partial [Oscillospiraceae bacterium]|nr:alanine racemase [Oscillospiraceae bacterium]